MIVPLAPGLYAAVCDLCRRQCPKTVCSSGHASRKAANAAGWVKYGRTRACPDCAEANALERG